MEAREDDKRSPEERMRDALRQSDGRAVRTLLETHTKLRDRINE